jgi:hypothetical protein
LFESGLWIAPRVIEPAARPRPGLPRATRGNTLGSGFDLELDPGAGQRKSQFVERWRNRRQCSPAVGRSGAGATTSRVEDWEKRWQTPAASGRRIVSGFFDRNDARANLDLWIRDGGVRGVWKSQVDGSKEVAIARGWREAAHHGLQRVATMVHTPEGDEFDFQLLLAPDGVRTVWKAGSFEARQ